MMSENETKEITASVKKETPVQMDTFTQKEKNPKRVSAGKKGVEARKIKAELKRKEEELLRKENTKLKQITRGEDPPALKDDETLNTDYALRTNSDKDSNINYNLLYLTIGVVGLGIYFYHKPSINLNQNKKSQASWSKRSEWDSSQASSALRIPVDPKSSIVAQKKEIDPFDF